MAQDDQNMAVPTTSLRRSGVVMPESSEWTQKSCLLIALCFVFNMIDGMDILVLSYISPALQRDWQISSGQMSVIFSAGLGGMAVGGILIAPQADRFGRRPLILFALTLMTIAMLGSSAAIDMTYLVVARVAVGIGIGTVLACIAALAAAHAPPHSRNFAVGVLQAGYPLGATVTGFLTAAYLPTVGWRHVLLASGVSSATVVALAVFFLPKYPSDRTAQARQPLRCILGEQRLASTLLLWSAIIGGFMALYFIASWITRLAIEAGLPETQAIYASAIYNIGSFFGVVGMSIASVRYDIRHLASRLLAASAAAFLWFGAIRMSVGFVLTTAFFLGIVLQGGFNALYPLAARVYPDAVRATGIGWAMGIGRIGAFSGPLLGGQALGLQWPLGVVFGMFCAPLLIAAVCVRYIRFDRSFAETAGNSANMHSPIALRSSTE